MRFLSLLLILATFAGCATTEGGGDADLQTGTFRGRWWDYYERGRTQLDAGNYAAAEEDLLKALANRGEDQRWARTYGLHFIPEYFPNRELGAVYFRTGRLDEAEARLQASLNQEHSALAAHFLAEVRAALIEARGGDTEAPAIQLNAAPGASPLGEFDTALNATITDNNYVARVTVNGEPWSIDLPAASIDLARSVPVDAGSNDIVIEATDLSGNTARQVLAVNSDHDGPAVSFDAPITLPGAVSGVVYDPAGVDALSIAGTAATLEAAADGAHRFRVEWRDSLPPTPFTFVARDTLGNATEGRVPVGRVNTAELDGVVVPVGAYRKESYDNGVDAFYVGSTLAWVELAQAPDTGLRVTLPNLADGQRYLMDEIVVAIEVESARDLVSLTLDGRPVEGLVPGRDTQHLSRRIRLADMGAHEVVAEARTAAGLISTARASIERAPTAIETPEEKLRVALLGNLWDGGQPKLEDEGGYIVQELTRTLFDRGRFDLVSRDALPRVLEEQELAAVLGSRAMDPGLRQLVSADLLTVGKVRRSGDTVEIILQAVSAADASILGYADVAGVANSLDDLRALAADLAVRFEQEFPRASGSVVQTASATQCYTSLSSADRVRPGMPCVVYRHGEAIVHPQTGAVLGRPVEIVAHGALDEVRPAMTRVRLDKNEAETATTPVGTDDLIITK